jgi:hypothetical protein
MKCSGLGVIVILLMMMLRKVAGSSAEVVNGGHVTITRDNNASIYRAYTI